MKQTINIDLLKKNNKIILTNLPEQAKNELVNFYQYIFYKYNFEYFEKIPPQKNTLKKSDFSFDKSLELTKNIDGNLSEFIINERRNEKW